MKIIGDIVTSGGQTIYVPWFNRVAPSIMPGTTLQGLLFPASGDSPAEIYLSPFPLASWGDLWRFEFEFYDRPGLLAEVTEFLQRARANILAEESVIVKHERVFQLTIICDMTKYGGPTQPDGSPDGREENPRANLQFLLDCLLIHMFEAVVFRLGQPQVSATRLRGLHSVYVRHRREPGSEISGTFKKGGILPLDRQVWKAFVSGTPKSDGSYKSTVISDTEERYIKINHRPKRHDFLLLKVLHRDAEGQIARFTKLLRDKFGDRLNINCSYHRLWQSGSDAEWHCLLEVEAGSVAQTRAEILQAFREAKLAWLRTHPTVYVDYKFVEPRDSRNEPSFRRIARRPRTSREERLDRYSGGR